MRNIKSLLIVLCIFVTGNARACFDPVSGAICAFYVSVGVHGAIASLVLSRNQPTSTECPPNTCVSGKITPLASPSPDGDTSKVSLNSPSTAASSSTPDAVAAAPFDINLPTTSSGAALTVCLGRGKPCRAPRGKRNNPNDPTDDDGDRPNVIPTMTTYSGYPTKKQFCDSFAGYYEHPNNWNENTGASCINNPDPTKSTATQASGGSPNSCPTGYTKNTYSNMCYKSGYPSKQPDGLCALVSSGGKITSDTTDPDCTSKGNPVMPPSDSVTGTDAMGNKIKITANADGSTSIDMTGPMTDNASDSTGGTAGINFGSSGSSTVKLTGGSTSSSKVDGSNPGSSPSNGTGAGTGSMTDSVNSTSGAGNGNGSGSGSGSGTSVSVDLSKVPTQCDKFPKSAGCQEHTANVGNCGSTPSCSGDAIQCAALADQFKRNCQFFEDSTAHPENNAEFNKLAAEPGADGTTRGSAWGSNLTNVDLSEKLHLDDFQASTDCPFIEPLSLTIGSFWGFSGTTVHVSISDACASGPLVARVILAAGALGCAFFFFRSIRSM